MIARDQELADLMMACFRLGARSTRDDRLVLDWGGTHEAFVQVYRSHDDVNTDLGTMTRDVCRDFITRLAEFGRRARGASPLVEQLHPAHLRGFVEVSKELLLELFDD